VCFQGATISFLQFAGGVTANMIIGIGGSAAVLFAMIGIGKFPTIYTLQNAFLLISMSVVSGYGGRRFLRIVTDKLEDQIGEATRTSIEAKEDAEDSILISKALSALRKGAPQSELSESLNIMEQVLQHRPKERAIVIILGRLYRKQGLLSQGIKVLDKFASLKKKDGELDKNYADALYNCALYKLLDNKNKGLNDDSQNAGAYEDLKESIRISPENAMDAKTDEDFEPFYNSDVFTNIVGS